MEATLVAVLSYGLALDPVRDNFDLAHLREIRKFLFGDIHGWAGEIRTVEISKGESRFAHHAFIESSRRG
ncbi:MAG: hypothetical protein WC284_06045 [Candidimonas sp.]